MKVRDWLIKRVPMTSNPENDFRAIVNLFPELCELELAQSHSEQELVCNPKKEE